MRHPIVKKNDQQERGANRITASTVECVNAGLELTHYIQLSLFFPWNFEIIDPSIPGSRICLIISNSLSLCLPQGRAEYLLRRDFTNSFTISSRKEAHFFRCGGEIVTFLCESASQRALAVCD
jgi:hypothetical protein